MRGAFLFGTILGLLLVLGFEGQGSATPTISRIAPSSGGTHGGTQVKIFGNGFATDQQFSDDNPIHEVYFASIHRRFPCDLHKEESDEQQLVCYTVPMPQDYYTLYVREYGRHIPTHYIPFQALSDRTPILSSLSFQSGPPGGVYKIVGTLYTNLVASNDVLATNGRTASIQRVLTSAYEQCDLFNETSTEPYGIFLYGPEGTYNDGEFTCLHKGTFVGYQNISFFVNNGHGRSYIPKSLYKIGASDEIYMFQTYAVVTDVNPKEGSTEGGTILTIFGNHFYTDIYAVARVTVGGRECEILSVNATEIQCKTSAQPTTARAMYSGGRGMIVEVFPGETDIATSLDSSASGTWRFFIDSTFPTSDFTDSNFVSRSKGFFVPAVTANYFFSAYGSDRIQFFFNKDGPDPSGTAKIIDSSGPTENSPHYLLTIGNEYYFEILHVGNTGEGYRVGVFVDKTSFTSAQVGSIRAEEQTISMSSPIHKEIQEISFVDYEEQDEAILSQWMVTFFCSDDINYCLNVPYRFELFGARTDFLFYNISTPQSVAEAFNGLLPLAGEEVNVTMEDDGSGFIIIFNSTRGQIEFKAIIDPAFGLDIDLMELEIGLPLLDTFTLECNGFVSSPLPVGASANEVKDQVNRFFGTSCPEEFGMQMGTAVAYTDMESGGGPSGSRTLEDSFCGSYSTKNPTYLYRGNYVPFTEAQHVCFAYIGDIAGHLHIVYKHAREEEDGSVTEVKESINLVFGELINSNEWIHVCLDINEAFLQQVQSDRFFPTVGEIVTGEGSDPKTNLFVDNIFVGVSDLIGLDEEEQRKLLNRVVPAAVTHVKLSRVDVAKSGSKYTITFHPLSCGNDFPLLGLAFPNSTEVVSDDQVLYKFANETPQVRVTRIEKASPPTTGTFNISFADPSFHTITGLSATTSSKALKNELESLRQIEDVDVSRTGNCYGYSWKVRFNSPGGDFPQMLPDASSLSSYPGPVELIGETTAIGGLNLSPIQGDYLKTAHDTPQVQVYIAGILSRCDAAFDLDSSSGCDFEWKASATPEVSNVSPSSGSSGTTITITGNKFGEEFGNVVKVGNVECVITSSTNTSITCILGDSPSGNQPLIVEVDGKGLGSGNAMFTVTGSVTSVAPSQGSANGCNQITISGLGFESTSSVSIGGSICNVIGTPTYDTLTCITTAGPLGPHEVQVTTAGVTVSTAAQYTYENPVASVTAVSATNLLIGESLTISGNGFGATIGEVRIGSGDAGTGTIFSWTDTEILVGTPVLPTGNYELEVFVPGDGCASSSITIVFSFTVTDVNPLEGSLIGGTEVTLTGTGFSKNMSVMFGTVVCDITSVSNDRTSCVCVTRTTGTRYTVRNTGVHPDVGLGYAWNPSTLEIIAGDIVTFGWDFPNFVNGELGLRTTALASEDDYDENGFFVAKIRRGEYTYTLNTVETIYYNGGCVTTSCSIILKGSIVLAEPQDKAGLLNVTYNGAEADYRSNGFTFDFTTGNTAIVTDISPRNGTTSSVIEIKGTGFGINPQVLINGKMCVVSMFTDSHISCSVAVSEELGIDTYYEVKVKTNAGYARNAIRLIANRTFVLFPEVTSISPTSGSQEGGTHVTITGSGFVPGATVSIGNWQQPCDVINDASFTYSSFVCVTRSVAANTVGIMNVKSGVSTVSCGNACSFSHLSSRTPVVASHTHDSNWGDLKVTFQGTGYETTLAALNVTFTSGALVSSCEVSNVDDTEVICHAPRFAVGPNHITLHVRGKGLAKFSPATAIIDNPADLYNVYPAIGSINGGTVLHLSGNGFVSGSTSVEVGGVSCDIQSTNFSHVVCVTGPRDVGSVNVRVVSNGQIYNSLGFEYSEALTPEVTGISPAEGSSGDEITLSGAGFGTEVSAVTVIIGGVVCDTTAVTDAEVKCNLGLREGGVADVQVHVALKGLSTIDLSFNYTFAASSITPSSGSHGGSQSVTISGEGFSNNTVITVCGFNCIVQSQTTQEITCLTPPSSNTSLDKLECDIMLANGANVVMMESAYSYAFSLTPNITKVSPDRGGTGGGTRITITGTGFSATQSSVTIDGVVCDVKSASTTQVVCLTRAHQGSLRTKIALSVGTKGIALQDLAGFFYIDRWSSIFTWGGTTVPADGDFVIIQKGQTVLLDSDTAILKMLLIDGGHFVFDEADVKLNAENILITNGGLLQVGTEDAPFQHKAIIEMHGHLRSPELPIYGAKTLGVRNGTLELHGRPIQHTWTLLAATASSGSTQITLQDSVSDWNVGDEIVIASTGGSHSQSQNEKRTITARSADGRTLTLDRGLTHTHRGVTEEIGGRTISFQAEVGLLTRNIVFRGSNDIAWNDEIPPCPGGFQTGQFATQTCFQGRFGAESGTDEFGGAIMIHSKYPTSPHISARIEHVEVTYAGQAFRLGRYPIHWHLMGNVSGMYVRKCAIHQSFNRAIVIHGTHNLLVEGNVVYNIMGGAIFIEDGIETKNVIQYNLAVFVRQSTSLLNDDITPAAYWVTNPDNIIRHNHAAGGTHFGFWYRMHKHPDGPSYTTSICQQKVELGEFFNNTVHSQGWYGLWIFKQYSPVVGGSCHSNIPSPARFRSLTTWNCDKGVEYVQCGAIQLIDFVMVDNNLAGMDLQISNTGFLGYERGSGVMDSLVVGYSSHFSGATRVGITLAFTAGFTINGTKFVNFNRGNSVFGGAFLEGACRANCGGLTYRFSNLSFEQVTKKMSFRWPNEGVLIDLDGTLLEKEPGSKLVAFTNIMDPELCVKQNGSMYSGGVQAAICDPSVKFHRFAANEAKDSVGETTLFFENEHGNASQIFVRNKLTHPLGYLSLLPTGKSYNMFWAGHTKFTNLSYNANFWDFEEGDKIFISHDFKIDPDIIQLNGRTYVAPENSTSLPPDSRDMSWAYNTYQNRFTVQLSNDRQSRKKRYALNAPGVQHKTLRTKIYKCFYDGCQGPPDPEIIPPSEDPPEEISYWSNSSNACLDWVSNDTVVVQSSVNESPCWVMVDVNNITVRNLTVLGTLHFADNDVEVNATYIIVLGRLLTQSTGIHYFENQLTFNLIGEPDDDAHRYLSVNLGSKAIGCFGGCEFVGIPRQLYWTRLEETAFPDDTSIKLRDEVHDWRVGEEIVITTTGFHAFQTEKHVIKAIADDNRTLTLETPLAHRHLGQTYRIGNSTYDMRAEVGLLTRNIRIRGVNYTDMEKDAYGGRVVVASLSIRYRGWGRFSDVEFFQTGQDGFTSAVDPRFSLAFVNTGTTSAARPSSVSGCAFHDGFATAIGIFGGSNIPITDNIVHRTIGSGMRITGSGHTLTNNLVTMMLYIGTWHDRNSKSEEWSASFDITQTRDLTLIGNVAAGSERVGFHTKGEACGAGESGAWRDNVAHSCLHGVHSIINSGATGCHMFRNFYVYKAYDFGILQYTAASAVVKDTVVVDSYVSFFAGVVGPPSLGHARANKYARYENITCVGKSDDWDRKYDYFSTSKDKNAKISRKIAGPQAPGGGKTCILLPLFTGGQNGSPKKFFHRIKTYPAINGLLTVEGLTAHKYQDSDRMFFTNPMNEDMFHPTHVSKVVMTDVNDANKVFFSRPNVGLVNPADCVDMECDAMKKALIKDLDGSFLGGVGAVIPEAEFGWDDPSQRARGLGDYRIPKTLLTNSNGRRIPVDDIIDQRGIVRNGACTKIREWQAYDCHGPDALDYQMLVIESLDGDTETRRLSPVAVIGSRTIDLSNGPQDHAWCFGYTCQTRISTFWVLVASGTHFDIYFTSYAPRRTRLHFLNARPDQTVRVAIWYARPERMDVYRTEFNPNLYIHPQNSHYFEERGYWALSQVTPSTVESFKPPINSTIHGANFMDLDTRLLYVTLRGSHPVDLVTVPAVYVKFGFPAVAVKDFFEENLIFNLANYLKVPQSKIRYVNVVREQNRKRRDTSEEAVFYTIMYSDELTNETFDISTEAAVIEVINNGARALIIAYQNGTLEEILGVNITSFSSTYISLDVSEEVNRNYAVVYEIPRSLAMTPFSSSVEEYLAFPEQPTVTLLDENENPVATLDDVFEVEVSLDKSVIGANPLAELIGTTRMMFTNGTIAFTDLMITHFGHYNLRFEIINPTGVGLNATLPVEVTQRAVQAVFANGGVNQILQHNSTIDVTIELQNSAGVTLPDVGFKGHAWKMNVSLDDPGIYNDSLSFMGNTNFNFDPATARVTTTGLMLLNTESNLRYNLKFTIYTDPEHQTFDIFAEPIKFTSFDEMYDLPTTKTLVLELRGIPYAARTSSLKITFDTYIHNKMSSAVDPSRAQIGTFSTATNNAGDTSVTVVINAVNELDADEAIETLQGLFSNRLSYNGQTLALSTNNCGVSVDGVCQDEVPTTAPVVVVDEAAEATNHWLYIGIGLGIAAVLAAIIITAACFIKRSNANKIGVGLQTRGCFDAASSRGTTPLFGGSIVTDSSDLTSDPSRFNMDISTGRTPISM